MKKILILFSLILCSISQSKMYIEPLLGYQTGTLDYKFLSTVNGGAADKGSFNGLDYGLGLGLVFDKFYIGADAQFFSLTSKLDTTGTSTNYTQQAFFLVGAYMVQPKARVFVGLGSMTTKDDATVQTTLTGTAAKVGAIYEFKNHIAGSADYVLYTINDSETGGVTTKIADSHEKFLYQALIWNFRFPFEF